MFSSDASERGCNRNDSLSHWDHFKIQTSITVRPIVITDRKANQYIDLYQLLALGNKEKDLPTMIKKQNQNKTLILHA